MGKPAHERGPQSGPCVGREGPSKGRGPGDIKAAQLSSLGHQGHSQISTFWIKMLVPSLTKIGLSITDSRASSLEGDMGRNVCRTNEP